MDLYQQLEYIKRGRLMLNQAAILTKRSRAAAKTFREPYCAG